MKRIALVFVFVAMTACGISAGKQQGEAFAEQYFATAERGDTASVLAMYDAEFYKAIPEPQWRETYGRIRTKLGKPRGHTLTTWNMNKTVGSGWYVSLVYQVQYETGNGTETIGVFLPGDSGRAGIRSHNFSSNDLLR